MSSEWSEVEVGQVCNITSSKRIFAHEYVERGVPFYGSKEIIDKALGTYSDTTVFISNARFAEIAAKFGYPEEGDLLLSSVGNRAGIPYVIKDEGKFYCKDGNLTWFKEFNGLNSSFLCHWMKSAIGQSSLHSIMIGSAQKALTITGLLKLRICLPSIRQQERIVAILNALDDRITLLRETNATLEAIAQALFKSWFVDFDPVRAKLEGRTPEGMDEATAALFPDEFEESELGLVPKGWRVGRFGDFINRMSVGKKFEQKTAHASGKVPILDQGKSGVIGFHDEMPGVRASLENPVVVFANHTCYMRLITFDFSAIQNVLPFVGLDIDTVWTFYATQNRVKFSEYKGHWPDFAIEKIVVPAKALTMAFRNVIDPLVRSIRTNEQQAQTLATLRDTLLPRLISGQLRLPEAL